jgi:hypothetical protein
MTGWLYSNLVAVLATLEVVAALTALVFALMLVDRFIGRDRGDDRRRMG